MLYLKGVPVIYGNCCVKLYYVPMCIMLRPLRGYSGFLIISGIAYATGFNATDIVILQCNLAKANH